MKDGRPWKTDCPLEFIVIVFFSLFIIKMVVVILYDIDKFAISLKI